jgi:hypothetical protein
VKIVMRVERQEAVLLRVMGKVELVGNDNRPIMFYFEKLRSSFFVPSHFFGWP